MILFEIVSTNNIILYFRGKN